MEAPPSNFSSKLLVNETKDFDCPLCLRVFNDPVQCIDGHVFCRDCLNRNLETKPECPICKINLTSSTASANRFVWNAIRESEVYCFTRLKKLEDAGAGDELADAGGVQASEDKQDHCTWTQLEREDAGAEDSAADAGDAKASDHCTWTVKLQDASKHFNQCDYAGVPCKFDNCGVVVMRKDVPEHEASCSFRTQPCKWCQITLLVEGPLIEHESICEKREVQCIHEPLGCTAVIPFDKRALHVANDCMYETVACPFSTVGCSDQMMRKDIENHEETAMKQHNRLLLQDQVKRCVDIQALQQKATSMEQKATSMEQKATEQAESIQALRRDNHSLQQKSTMQDTKVKDHTQSIQKLQQKIDNQEERAYDQALSIGSLWKKAAVPLREIVFRVKLTDLVMDGERLSHGIWVGGYKANMSVFTGTAQNGDSCGVYLRLQDGPIPCQVSFTIEVVHWDGKPASTNKLVCPHIEWLAQGVYGWSKIIPLSKLTAAASPYCRVKDGEVTFIANFQILPAV